MPSGSSTEDFTHSSVRATCLVHLILLDLITLIISVTGSDYEMYGEKGII